MMLYRIKPLEWSGSESRQDADGMEEYRVDCFNGEWAWSFWDRHGRKTTTECDSTEVGKVACQSHHEELLRRFLVEVPNPIDYEDERSKT